MRIPLEPLVLWYPDLFHFRQFILSQDKINLEVLNFKKCKLFSNNHLNMLIKYGNGHLKKLKITNAMKVDPEGLLRASQFVKIEGPKFLENIE